MDIRIVPQGQPVVLIGISIVAFLGVLVVATPWPRFFALLATVSVVLVSLLGWFFRDPERMPDKLAQTLMSQNKTAILSPADGRVTDITDIGDMRRIGIFLSVFDCHVQRIPVDGTVTDVKRKNGKFLAAFDHRASEENASSTVTIENPVIGKVLVRQITGLLARRIITDVKTSDPLKTGGRLGMILLGSRAELEVPKNKVEILVKKGSYVYAGTTVVGSYENTP